MGQKNLGSNEGFIGMPQRRPGDDITVFVHGYNTAARVTWHRFAQIEHDFEVDAPLVLFA